MMFNTPLVNDAVGWYGQFVTKRPSAPSFRKTLWNRTFYEHFGIFSRLMNANQLKNASRLTGRPATFRQAAPFTVALLKVLVTAAVLAPCR
jgi:hypothetical protein